MHVRFEFGVCFWFDGRVGTSLHHLCAPLSISWRPERFILSVGGVTGPCPALILPLCFTVRLSTECVCVCVCARILLLSSAIALIHPSLFKRVPCDDGSADLCVICYDP